MADACLMLTYITISTVARFKNIFASWSRTDYAQKGSHRRNGNGDACSLVTHLANSITGRLYEYHRVVTAFRLHSVRNLKIQAPYASAVESSLSRTFVRSCFYFSRRLFFAKQFRHPLTDFRSVFFIVGPMCNIMVRFPNGSRTHISLSADSSLKVRSEQRQDFKLVKN